MGGTFVEEAYEEIEEFVEDPVKKTTSRAGEIVKDVIGPAMGGGEQPAQQAPDPSDELKGPSDAEVADETMKDKELSDTARMRARRTAGGSKAGNILAAPSPDEDEDEASLAKNVLLGV